MPDNIDEITGPQSEPIILDVRDRISRSTYNSILRHQDVLRRERDRIFRSGTVNGAEFPMPSDGLDLSDPLPNPSTQFVLQGAYFDSTANTASNIEMVPMSPTTSIKKKVTALDEKQVALERALDQFSHQEHKKREARNLPNGRRETEYLRMIENSKYTPTTVDKLLGVETPLLLGELDYAVIQALIKSGYKGLSQDSDKRVMVCCSTCNTKVRSKYGVWCLGSVYCVEHVPQIKECVGCKQLTGVYTEVRSFSKKEVTVCRNCCGRLRCRNCEDRIPPEYAEFRLCRSCIDRTPEEGQRRTHSVTDAWMSNQQGVFIQSPRIYSCEVEVLIKNPLLGEQLLHLLPPEVGVTGDGSIRGPGIGTEIQTPRLAGAKGEELITDIGRSLKKVAATINQTCGMHIHLDGAGIFPERRDEYPQTLINLWKAHLVFEDTILSFLPYKRRLNEYCRPMKDYFSMSELSLLTSMYDVEKLWYRQNNYSSIHDDKNHHYHPSRYFGVNLHSLLADKNLEIRYHSGTMNPQKILHWINLHALIMDNASRFTQEFFTEIQATPDLREKAQLLFDFIKLSPESQEYFFARQSKFNSKKEDEDELTGITS